MLSHQSPMRRETIHALLFIPQFFSDAEAEVIITEAKTVDEIREKLTSETSNPYLQHSIPPFR